MKAAESTPTGVKVRSLTDEEIAERETWMPTDWMREIEARADTELNKGITVTKDGVDYLVATTPSARSLIAGAKVVAQEAINAGTTLTRKIPTDKGIVPATEKELVALFNIVDRHHQDIMDRVEQLHDEVAAGTMTEAKLDSGWP